MRLIHLYAALCLACIVTISCSKSQVNEPILPPPPDDSAVIVEPPPEENQPPATYDVEVTSFPILNRDIASELYIGAIIKGNDLGSLAAPVITEIQNKDRNGLTIYTNTSMDDFYLPEVLPSKKTDAILLNRISQHFKESPNQIISVTSASPKEFGFRFNFLRGYFGINEDLNKYLDLGFADTTKLSEDKGRVIMYFSMIKTSLLSEPPIYHPFLKIKEGDKNWLDLFGTGLPQIVSAIDFGSEVLLVVQSDSSAAKLIPVLNQLFTQNAADIVNGTAFDKLSATDLDIIEHATTYGYALGKGISLSHNCKEAIQFYASELVEIGKTDNIGVPIRYNLNGVTDYKLYKSTFAVTDYPQMVKEK